MKNIDNDEYNNNDKEIKHPHINPNNEIKISENTDVHETIDFIINLFTLKNYETIIICGLNKAIRKVVLIAEIIKTKIPGLYQLNEINCLGHDDIIDNENNSDKIIPRLAIKLTFIEPSSEEKEKLGYQKPLNILQVNLINKCKNKYSSEEVE